MAHPGGGEHCIISDVIRKAFITLFNKFDCYGVAGVSSMDTFNAILTNQYCFATNRIKHPAVYPDLVIWADEQPDNRDLSVVLIEIGKFNSLGKVKIDDPIIHIGFDWVVTPINCQTSWSKTVLKVINAIAEREQVDGKFQITPENQENLTNRGEGE